MEPAPMEMPRFIGNREYYPYFWGTVALFTIGLLSLGGGVYWLMSQDANKQVVSQVYFEIKAVDNDGHPVAGAQVSYQKKTLGVTDSFGEWRKFYSVPLGSSLTIGLQKKTAHGYLHASKNFAVPLRPPAKGELILSSTVKLEKKRTAPSRSSSSSSSSSNLSDTSPPLVERPGNHTPSQALAVQAGLTAAVQPSLGADMPYRSIWFKVLENSFTDASSVHRRSMLQRLVVTALQEQARNANLEVTPASRWQVGLVHVSYPGVQGFPGVIRVIANREDDGEKVDFLANYTGRAATTAQEILTTLATHTPQRVAVYSHEGRWFADPAGSRLAKLWPLREGGYLMNPGGEFFRLQAAIDPSSKRTVFRLNPQAGRSEPCAVQEDKGCYLRFPFLPKHPPGKGWGIKRMRVDGVREALVDVYVSGLKAIHEGQGIWRFWQQAGNGGYLTVVKQGSLVYRKKISDGLGASPAAPLSTPAMVRK